MILHKKRYIIITSFTTLLLMFMIFSFSAQNGEISSNTSNGVMKDIVLILSKIFTNLFNNISEDTLIFTDHIIRKTAHFSEYAFFGASLYLLISGIIKPVSQKLTLAVVFAYIYAGTDEIHQFFVPGRSCQFTDVLIDTAGAVFGILTALLIFSIIMKKRKLNKS